MGAYWRPKRNHINYIIYLTCKSKLQLHINVKIQTDRTVVVLIMTHLKALCNEKRYKREPRNVGETSEKTAIVAYLESILVEASAQVIHMI